MYSYLYLHFKVVLCLIYDVGYIYVIITAVACFLSAQKQNRINWKQVFLDHH